MSMTLLVGEKLAHRSFNGANKALSVLASSLHNAGYQSLQLDLERPDISIDDVCREAAAADLVAFAGCMTPQWPELDGDVRKVAEYLEEIGKGDVPLLIGGYATKGVEDVARVSPWITAFFDGEGEEMIVELARWASRGSPREEMKDIEGLCYYDAAGQFHKSTARRVKNFDDIDQSFGFVHIPGIHDMDIFTGPDSRQLKTAQLYSQRGCPWACSYCNKSLESPSVVRLAEDVFRRQLRDLKARGFEAVYLDVDTFSVNMASAYDEAAILADEGFIWGSNTRIDTASLRFIRHLVDHKCVYMFFGVEHTDPGILLAVNKFNGSLAAQLGKISQYRDSVKRVFRDMRTVGLPSSFFMILGLPKAVLSEDHTMVTKYVAATFEDDLRTIEFGLDECEPDYLNFNMLRFMPGSAAADTPNHPAYSCVRPSGERPVTAGYFLPRVAKANCYPVPDNHGVYRLCESVGKNQPTTTAVDAERIYDSIRAAVDLINRRIDSGHAPTRMFVEKKIQDMDLLSMDGEGRYRLAPIVEFDGL